MRTHYHAEFLLTCSNFMIGKRWSLSSGSSARTHNHAAPSMPFPSHLMSAPILWMTRSKCGREHIMAGIEGAQTVVLTQHDACFTYYLTMRSLTMRHMLTRVLFACIAQSWACATRSGTRRPSGSGARSSRGSSQRGGSSLQGSQRRRD